METINILGIESSCDETAASVVRNGREVLSNSIYSQINIHKKYGGVVPEIASRNHIEKIDEVVRTALDDACLNINDLHAIAVTNTPGLVGALLVGVSFAKALAYGTKKPLIGVNHIEGHICANYIGGTNVNLSKSSQKHCEPPFICLVVSGGHTHLLYVSDYGVYNVLGRTRDDAAGEAYDKVARALGLPYPGGVEIDKLSRNGDINAISFPQANLGEGSLDFSFSGLKSAVLNYINSTAMSGAELNRADIAASFQKSVVDVLVKKSINACKIQNCQTLALAGGVSSNTFLRKEMADACSENGITLFVPEPVYCTDNAAMIASCAFFDYKKDKFAPLSLNAYPTFVFE